MKKFRIVAALLAVTAAVVGCSPDKPADPKVNGPVDPKIQRVGRDGGGDAKPAGKGGAAGGGATETPALDKK
jgi:hypothetical protein